jgi:LCP family protein required for cell wall assembly
VKEAPLVRKPELGSAADVGSTPDTDTLARARRNQTPFDPPRRSAWKTFWKWTGIFSLVAIAGLLGYFTLTSHGRATGRLIGEFGPAVMAAKTNPNLIFDRTGSDVVNILLIGRDVNWVQKKVYDPTRKIWARMQVPDETTPARSDTMLIMSLDRVRKTIHMVSLPRDARVHMPENKYGVHRAKLNAAHAYGGPEMLVQAIHDDLGITIHHYAVIRFEGFKKLIDQVGGVEVDVIGALHRDGTRGRLKYDDNWGNLHIDLQPGKQVLNGEQAHNYVRFRMDLEGDPGRIKRQQQVMRALAKKLASQPFWNLAPLVQEIRQQFKTDSGFDAAQMASAADFAKSLGDPSKMQPLTLFGVYGTRGSLILNESKNKKLLRYIFGPTFNEDNFLQNSPSTEKDEMGEENNSSPGAKAILRKAGILKGAPGDDQTVTENHAETTEARSSASEVSGVSESENPSRLAENDSSTRSTQTETPHRRTRRSPENTETPAPRRSRTRDNGSTPSIEEAPTGDERASRENRSDESPIPVPEGGLSTPVDATSSN